MAYVYCGNTGTESFPRFITHGSDGATVTAENTTRNVSLLSKKVNL